MGSPVPPPLPDSPERRLIDEQLDRTQAQVKTVDALFGLLAMAVGALGMLLAAAVVDHWVVGLGVGGRVAVFAVLVAWVAFCGWRWILPAVVRRINPLYAAHAIERHQPSLKNSLINYLLVRAHPEAAGAVVQDALERQAASDISRAPVDAAVDRTHVLRLGYALVAVVLVFALYKIASPKDPFQTAARVLAPLAEIARPSRVAIREMTPGTDSEVFHGRHLEVSAVIDGLHAGETPTLVFSSADGQVVDAPVPMAPSDDRLRWQASLPPDSLGAQQDFQYHLRAGDALSKQYRVRVSPAPSLVVRSIEYVYPAYTRRPPQTVADRGDISALEGTRVTVRAEANLPIQSAWIEFDPPVGGALAKKNASGSPPKRLPMKVADRAASGAFRLEWDSAAAAPRHRAYRVQFVTAEGHRNERPIVYAIDVQRDLPPEVAILEPRQNRVEVPEDSQVEIVIRALDPDFGLSKITLSAVSGGSSLPIPLLLSDPQGQTGQVVVKHVFAPRDHKLKAGDQVVYWARVEDNRATPGQDTPEPNAVRTRNYHLVITPPEKGENASSAGEKSEPSESEKASSGEGEKADEGESGAGSDGMGEGEKNEGQGDNGSGESNAGESEGQQGGMSEGKSKEGESGKSPQNSGGQGANASSKGETGDQQTGEGGGQGASRQGDTQGNTQENGAGTGESAPSQDQPANQSSNGPSSDGAKSPKGRGGQQGAESPRQDSPAQGDPSQNGGDTQQPLSPDGTQDREVFDRIQEYLKEQQKNQSGQSGGQPEGRADDSPSNGSTPTSESPNGNRDGAGKSSPTPRPGESAQQAGQPEQDSPAQHSEEKHGDAEGDRAGSGEGGSPQGPAETQPEKANPQNEPGAKQPNPGLGDSGDSGAGAKTDNSRGSPDSQEENRDRQKNSEAGNEKENDSGSSARSTSKKQSDSQGRTGGDRSGGGEQGGGQGSKQAGNDSAGSSSAADEGAGAANEAGAGETTNQPGEQKLADQPTGNPSETPGAGSGTQPNPQGQGPQDPSSSPPKSRPGEAPPMPPGANTPPLPGETSRGDREGVGQHTFGAPPQGGAPDQDPQREQTPPPVVPENADVNLEYAKKATDLALETLRDQKGQPDAELLDRLGWTPEDLQRFLARWEAMKRAAAQDGAAGEEAQRSLNETLESLGLRPTNTMLRRGGVESDQQRGLRDAGHRTAPPPEYQKLFEAYLKGAGRAQPSP